MATKKTSTAKKPVKTVSKTTRAKKTLPPAEASPKPKATVRKRRTPAKASATLPSGFTLEPKAPAHPPQISPDEIATRAYFISERRNQMGWHGDSHSDWVEAEAQLRAEALAKPLKKR
jgi:Protein of unknown function (DUF2934)